MTRICLFVILIILVWPVHGIRAGETQRPPIASVSAAEIATFLKRNPLILDVRVAGEERGGDDKPWGLRCRTCRTVRAPYDLDMGFFEDRHEALLHRLQRGQQILIVCQHGVRAQKAAEELHASGHPVIVLHGGLRGVGRKLLYGIPPVIRSESE